MRNALKTASLVALATFFLVGCTESEAAKEPAPPPPVYKIVQKSIDGTVTFEDRLVSWYSSEYGCVKYKAPSDSSDAVLRYVCGGLITIVPE